MRSRPHQGLAPLVDARVGSGAIRQAALAAGGIRQAGGPATAASPRRQQLPPTPACPAPFTPQQTKSGVVHEGIFHALHPAGSDFDVLLRMAKPRRDAWADDGGDGDGEWQPVRPVPLLTIPGADLVQITAVDVRMGPADVGGGGAAWDDAGGFGTDAAISRSRGNWGRERELQRWAPDEGEASQMLHLEESVGPVSRGWDQFAVNEAKFGVRTDYAEELYTTELNPRCARGEGEGEPGVCSWTAVEAAAVCI